MADNIYEFPATARKPIPVALPEKVQPKHEAKAASPVLKKSVLSGLWRGLWVLTVLLWPFLKWIVSLDVLGRLVIALYHWDTPGSYAGWTFIGHFIVLVTLTWYVSAYKPKGI